MAEKIFDTNLRIGGPTGPLIIPGAGSPEGVVTAPVGSQFHRTDGGAGTTIYHKESGSGNTGWVATAAGGGGGSGITESIKTADYTLTDTDLSGGKLITFNAANPVNLTINNGLIGASPVMVHQIGKGPILIRGTASLKSYKGLKSAGQFSLFNVVPRGSDNYIVEGELDKEIYFRSYQFNASIANITTTYTALNIGPEESSRWVIAALLMNHNTSRAIASVTIGGVTATKLGAEPVLSASGAEWSFWKAPVPTGTSASVVVTANTGSMYDGSCALYTTSSEPIFSAIALDTTFSGGEYSLNLNVPQNGAVLALSASQNAATLSSWSGVIADFSDTTRRIHHASISNLQAETGRLINSVYVSGTPSPPGFVGLCAIALIL